MTPGGVPAAADGADVTYGIDIGGTKVLGLAVGPGAQVVAEARVPTPAGSHAIGGRHVAEAIEAVVADLDRTLGVPGAPAGVSPPAVGVGAPGMVDREGRLRFAPNLPQAAGVDWTELVGSRLPGRPLLIENDANLAALAEHQLGAAQGYARW